MPMTQPMEPELPHHQAGIPAADGGTGAPPPAEGFGVAGEEPDVASDDGTPSTPSADTPFRTPDPLEIGPEQP